jgi:RNA polymerase sigma factor (sigma-70 family)
MTNHRLNAVLHQVFEQTTGVDALTDRGLLSCFVARRDESAFRALVERHGPMVLAVCRRILHDDHAAEDAWQAAFLVLARRADSLRDGDSLASWLHGVAFRVSSNLRRQIQRRRAREVGGVEGAVPGREADPAAALTWAEARTVIDEELAALPQRQRAPLVLCYLEGKTCDEAARELGWSLTTFRGRLERGRHRLRARVTRRGLSLTAGLPAAVAKPLEVPAALTSGTVRAALAGSGGLEGMVSERVGALTKEALRAMWMSKIRVVLLLLVVVVFGGGLVAFQLPAGEPTTAEKEEAKPAGKEEAPLVYALVQVMRPEQEPGVPRPADGEKEHEAYRRTAAALMKTRLVLAAALRRPDVRTLPLPKDKKDPLVWLEDSLVVDYPNDGDILRVGVRGRERKQLGTLVNAVAEECVKSSRDEQSRAQAKALAEIEELADTTAKELEVMRERLRNQSKALGIDVAPALRQYWLTELGTVSQELRRVRMQRVAVQVRRSGSVQKRLELKEEVEALTEQEKLLTAEKAELLAQVTRQNAEPGELEALRRDIAATEEAKRQIDRKRSSLRVKARNADRLRILELAEVPKPKK